MTISVSDAHLIKEHIGVIGANNWLIANSVYQQIFGDHAAFSYLEALFAADGKPSKKQVNELTIAFSAGLTYAEDLDQLEGTFLGIVRRYGAHAQSLVSRDHGDGYYLAMGILLLRAVEEAVPGMSERLYNAVAAAYAEFAVRLQQCSDRLNTETFKQLEAC